MPSVVQSVASFDNLAVGFALSLLGYVVIPSALVLGGVSASLCFFGLRAGSAISSHRPFRADLAGAIELVLAPSLVALREASE